METPLSTGPTGGATPPPPPPFGRPRPRELRRRPDEGHIGGVCAGLADYFNVDPVLVRIAAVVLLITGPGAVAYILGWIFIPPVEQGAPMLAPAPPSDGKGRGMQIFGIVLLALAVSVFWGDWWAPSGRWLFPFGLMALGAWLLLRRDDDGAGERPPAGPGWVAPGHAMGHGMGHGMGHDMGHGIGHDMGHDLGHGGGDGTTESGDAATDSLRQTGPSSWSAAAPGATTAVRSPLESTTTDDLSDLSGASGSTTVAGGDPATTGHDAAGDDAGDDAGDRTDVTAPWAVTGGGAGGDGTAGPPPFPWGGPPPLPPEPTAAQRRRRMLGPVVMGALLVWAGLAWIFGVALETSLAVALCIVGVGFVFGAFVGGSWALIVPATLIAGALATATIVDIPLSGPVGDRTWAPQTVDQVADSYEVSVGEGTLDLTDLVLTADDHLEVRASVGIGHLVVEVPDGVALEIETDVAMGESALFGVRNNGVSVSDERTVAGDGSSGTIVLDLEVGMGQVEVRRNPALPDVEVPGDSTDTSTPSTATTSTTAPPATTTTAGLR